MYAGLLSTNYPDRGGQKKARARRAFGSVALETTLENQAPRLIVRLPQAKSPKGIPRRTFSELVGISG